jgi:hypothetical protein
MGSVAMMLDEGLLNGRTLQILQRRIRRYIDIRTSPLPPEWLVSMARCAGIDQMQDGCSQFIPVNGLYDTIRSAAFHGVYDGRNIALAAQHQERCARVATFPATQQFNTVELRGLDLANHKIYIFAPIRERIINRLRSSHMTLISDGLQNHFSVGGFRSGDQDSGFRIHDYIPFFLK